MDKLFDNFKMQRINGIVLELFYACILAIPFVMMDLVIRQLSRQINYKTAWFPPSVLFSLIWIMFFVGISFNLQRRIGRIFYSIFFGIFFLAFLVNSVYFSYMGMFFSFNLLAYADEASGYIWNVIVNTSPFIYLAAVLVLAVGICIIVKYPKKQKKENCNFLALGIVIVLFIILHLLFPSLYGENKINEATWHNSRAVYENFNDSNKSLKLSGFYEYVCRDFYVTFLGKEKEDPKQIEFLENEFAEMTVHEENDYTGIFEGKNLIFLQLESIDTWLFNEEDMPNLYSLLKNSLNFENHYSYKIAGATFNSDFVVNTGLVSPVSYAKHAYTFSFNTFYSMADMFKDLGYRVNAFHMNEGEYYSRRTNYQNWGYDEYYGLQDVTEYENENYYLDRELIQNEIFYDKMFSEGEPFVNYLITFSAHMPYDETESRAEFLTNEIYGEDIPELTEEEYARMYASETDYMVELLMEALEENGLLEDTVIVAYADHYAYSFNDRTILERYKETENNLVNHTPFFIWSYGMEAETVEKVNSQLDILPTVLNLFGIEYMDEYYIGSDVMDSEYSGYVFFNDYSWYDGNAYVEAGKVTNGAEVDKDYVEQMNSHINELIQRNDWVLKYDYFKNLKK